MIITILLAGLLLILAAGIRCGFALDDLIRMAVNGIKKAVNILSEKGYKVFELDKGFNSWQEAGKEIEH